MAYQHNLLVRHPLRLSSLEARIFVLSLKCVSQSETEFAGGFVIELADLFLAGSSGERYEALEEAFKALLSKNFKLEMPAAGDGSYIYTQLISHIGIETGAGRVVGAFAPQIAPYLSQLTKAGNYTSAKIETLLTFKNATAQRLYWLLRSWASLGKKEISVEELKKQLFEDGETYSTYADFKRYVLKPCLAEVQKYGGWDVTYKEEKQGTRKVQAVTFIIPKISADNPDDSVVTKAPKKLTRTATALDATTLSEPHQRLATRLQKLQLKPNQVQDVLSFVGNDKGLFERAMKATYKTLTDFEQKNFNHVPLDKLAAATVNILKSELGIWK